MEAIVEQVDTGNLDVEQVLDIARQFNWIDWGILAIVLIAILGGIQRGFVLGALDLAGMAVSLAAAIAGHRPAAELIQEVVAVPQGVAVLGAFLGIIVLAQIIYSTIVNALLHLSQPVRRHLGALSPIDRLFGMLPGAVQGIIFATLALLPFAMLPLIPTITAGIERSYLGPRLVGAVVTAAPEVESLLGRDMRDSLTFLTPPQTDEGIRTNFGPLGRMEPDPVAEQRMLELVNVERARAGLGALEFDTQLREVARAHSVEMFELGYFSHTSPVTGSPFDRIRRAGIGFLVAGENLAYAPNVQIAHEGLMNSPGHRDNILRPQFGRVGIGVIRSQFRGSMFTQKFRN